MGRVSAVTSGDAKKDQRQDEQARFECSFLRRKKCKGVDVTV